MISFFESLLRMVSHCRADPLLLNVCNGGFFSNLDSYIPNACSFYAGRLYKAGWMIHFQS
jgi:hypothetical protein